MSTNLPCVQTEYDSWTWIYFRDILLHILLGFKFQITKFDPKFRENQSQFTLAKSWLVLEL